MLLLRGVDTRRSSPSPSSSAASASPSAAAVGAGGAGAAVSFSGGSVFTGSRLMSRRGHITPTLLGMDATGNTFRLVPATISASAARQSASTLLAYRSGRSSPKNVMSGFTMPVQPDDDSQRGTTTAVRSAAGAVAAAAGAAGAAVAPAPDTDNEASAAAAASTSIASAGLPPSSSATGARPPLKMRRSTHSCE